jgi:hypothetical protein
VNANQGTDSPDFGSFSAALIGLPVSRIWQGYGSAIFLEFGNVQPRRRRDGSPGNPRGEWTLMIEWSWRIEGKRRIWCGSWSDGERWPRAFARLQGQPVTSIELVGRLPEVYLGFANGVHLASMMTAEGDPAWSLSRRQDHASVSIGVRAGRLILDNEHADSTSDRASIAKELGNLRIKLRPRKEATGFLPGVHWVHIEETIKKLQLKEPIVASKEMVALRDLQELEMVHEGRIKASGLEGLKASVASALCGVPYDRFWTAVARGEDLDPVLVSIFSLGKLSPSTVVWRRKLLLNWGKAVGLIPDRQVRRTKVRDSASLFA